MSGGDLPVVPHGASRGLAGFASRLGLALADTRACARRFRDAKFAFKGVTSRFFPKDGKYFVETDSADGKLQHFEIKYVVGVAPLQQYLVDTGHGRLQALDLAWDTVAKRWYHLYPNEDVTARNGLHWTGPYKNWQARCAVCHQTDFKKNYSEKDRSYHTTWKDLTVACRVLPRAGRSACRLGEGRGEVRCLGLSRHRCVRIFEAEGRDKAVDRG